MKRQGLLSATGILMLGLVMMMTPCPARRMPSSPRQPLSPRTLRHAPLVKRTAVSSTISPPRR